MPTENSTEVATRMKDLLPGLRAFARTLAGDGDRADALTQRTLVSAIRAFDRRESIPDIRLWLFSLLHQHYFFDISQSVTQENISRSLIPGRGEDDGTAGVIIAMAVDATPSCPPPLDFRMALTRLVPEQREALILVVAAGFSVEEAARVCGRGVAVIDANVQNARVHLARLLDVPSCAALH